MTANKNTRRTAGCAIVMALALTACNRGKYPETPFRHADLPATTFNIESGRDTSLLTPGGARIGIPAGSLESDSGGVAQLIVREAYTVGQMLRGSLTTVSGSDILSAGGVIAVQPGAHTKERPLHPLQISFSPAMTGPGMQLWTDTSRAPRRIDWQAPQPLQAAAPFVMTRFGWYSTAVLIKDLEGFENYNVLAQFGGAIRDGISVYLILPEEKILLEGGPATSGAGTYAFYRNDGTVPLRPGKPGIVVGVKQVEGQWHFASTRFTAAPSQTLQLELKPVSGAELEQAVAGLGAE